MFSFLNVFELEICKSIKDTKIWGRLKLDMWAIKFWWESCKIHQNLDHDSIKHFLVFFSNETWLYIFFVIFLAIFVWNFFWSSFSSELYVPQPQQSLHHTSSIKPCLVPSFLHCFQNLLLMNQLSLKLWMTSMYIFIRICWFIKQHCN